MDKNFATKLIHGKGGFGDNKGAVSVPVYNSSTFHQQDIASQQEYEYSRSNNPTRKALEELIAELEAGKHGFAFASGIAAIAASLLIFRQGDHILAPKDVYGGTYRLLTTACPRWGISHTLVDTTSLEEIQAAVRPETKCIFLESPSNPLLKISDLPKICAWAREQGLITIIDNTFMTPYLQRPLEFGADIVVHSATKFLAGHSDVIAGLAVTNNIKLAEELYFIQNGLGAILGPQDSWLVIRGIKTLKARMDYSQRSAQYIAEQLLKEGNVRAVYYPGLPSHPGHELLASQAQGFGAVLSFETITPEVAKKVMAKVQTIAVAVSLGAVESILSYPATMSHAAIPQEVRYSMGITDCLLRFSVGLEDREDLLHDLLAAMR